MSSSERKPTSAEAIGALSRINDKTLRGALGLVKAGRVYDLGLELNSRIPHNPEFVCFAMSFTHTPEGTVATVTACSGEGSVVVEVSDDGPGVPADRLPRIFDRFYRAGTRQPGSGLGLAIVTEVAAAHEGSAVAALNYPQGLRVTLSLPAADPARREVDPGHYLAPMSKVPQS